MAKSTKVILSGGSRASQRLARQHIGKLKDHIIRPQTKQRYEAAVARVFRWLDAHKLKLPANVSEVDRLLEEYLEYLWSQGGPKGWAGDALSGLTHFIPRLRGELRGAWRLYRAWGQLEIPARAAPISMDVAFALTGIAVVQDDMGFAVLILLGFFGILRTGEALGLCVGDLTFSQNLDKVHIHLGYTKSGLRKGVVEASVIEDPEIVFFVHAAIGNWDKKRLLYTGTHVRFRIVFPIA